MTFNFADKYVDIRCFLQLLWVFMVFFLAFSTLFFVGFFCLFVCLFWFFFHLLLDENLIEKVRKFNLIYSWGKHIFKGT